ncbi:SDR family oxidoreductase [candidate division KSB1 bacterium]|nr:SDR family oxidoreductase [candidate division KSB1 bacterium]
MPNFFHKTVLVTGASGGIGRAIAQQFAEHDAQVVVHFNKNERAAKETLESLKGDSHRLAQADLTQPDELPNLVETISRGMGKIDVLINNAGIFEVHPILDMEYEEWQQIWQKTVATNLLGPANLTFCVAKHMMLHDGGKIVNISSRGAFRGEPDAPAYGATKAGLNAMSQSLAKALAPHNIFFFVIAPGFVDTDRVSPILYGPQGDEIRNQSPLGRVAKPREVAHTALFLASEGSEFLTGCIVDVNGASYLRS